MLLITCKKGDFFGIIQRYYEFIVSVMKRNGASESFNKHKLFKN